MKTARRLAILTAYSLGFCLQFAPDAGAAPFVPIEWQQRVKAGALENQRKHIGWMRDKNADFLDDAFDALAPGETTKVIVQLSECKDPQEIANRFGAFGTVRRIGTLVAYVIIDGVKKEDLPALASDPLVAAVEKPKNYVPFLDTSTRAVRARASMEFTPETFPEEVPAGVNGSGVNIAIVDTGVDDAVHAAFAGKFVSGYDACTDTPGNPDDDLPSPLIVTGPDGICNTAVAVGSDDVQLVPVGGTPISVGVGSGLNNVLNSIVGPDDLGPVGQQGCDCYDVLPCLMADLILLSGPLIATGPDGIGNSTAMGDDHQVVPAGGRPPNLPCIGPGPNGVIDTATVGDDVISVVHHGTHVAGIALGAAVAGAGCRPAADGFPDNCAGVAPGAGLVDVKVFSGSAVCDEETITRALEWIWMDGNARVVNMSLGCNFMSDGSDTISGLVNALVANDITVVVASGNSGGNWIGPIAASELAITVGNADDRGTVDRSDDRLDWSSTFGPRADIDLDPGDTTVGMLKPDLAAPGTDIFSAQGNTAGTYHSLSGTSMASPHVAGVAALLLDYESELTPGALKELLKRTAFQPLEHVAAGPSYPAVNGIYHVKWGFGLVDAWQAVDRLMAGITDVAFTACIGPHPDYPTVRRCLISGGRPSYENDTDIVIGTDPDEPTQEVPTTLTIRVENRGASAAEDVVVCVGVKELGVGPTPFYDVGCKTVDIPAGDFVTVIFNWTPSANDHQCIQATIDYPFDTDFSNNLTQRNTDPVFVASQATATFRVQNPFNELATIVLTPTADPLTRTNFNFDLIGPRTFQLTPQDCPRLSAIQFNPNGNLPIGSTGKVVIAARATTASHPEGIELSGVVFKLRVVAAGLQRAYSVGRHGPEGQINLPLNLAGVPTSDPRLTVNEILAVFNVTVGTSNNVTLSPQQVLITSSAGNPIPPYTVAFAGGGNSGQELTIRFSQPLVNRDRYRINFARFVDTDGDRLRGDTDVEFRVLQGDANSSGAVTGTDVSFVRGRINQQAAFGESSRSDVNMSGAITGPDISFVRSRIGNAAP